MVSFMNRFARQFTFQLVAVKEALNMFKYVLVEWLIKGNIVRKSSSEFLKFKNMLDLNTQLTKYIKEKKYNFES